MVHYIVMAEGMSESLRAFEKEFDGRRYAGNKSMLRVRELKFYDLALRKEGEEEFLRDLKSLTGGYVFQHTKPRPFKWQFMINTARKIAGMFGIKPFDDSKVESSGLIGSRAEGKLSYNSWFISVGRVEDQHFEGIEEV